MVIKFFKNKDLKNFSRADVLHFAMMAFSSDAICTVNKATFLEGACLHLKSPMDDMTKAGLPVNMHAVHHAVLVDLCLSSSIG